MFWIIILIILFSLGLAICTVALNPGLLNKNTVQHPIHKMTGRKSLIGCTKQEVTNLMNLSPTSKSNSIWYYNLGFISNFWIAKELCIYLLFDKNDIVINQLNANSPKHIWERYWKKKMQSLKTRIKNI